MFVMALSQQVFSQGCDPINSLSAQVGDAGIELSWNYTPAAVSFFYDFEDGSLNPWTQIDADGDGNIWEISLLDNNGHESQFCTMSSSYSNSFGALHPDNYFVSPLTSISAHATLRFWVAAQDAYYPSEHYGVAISTESNTNPNDFTTIWEETLTAKDLRGVSPRPRETNTQGQWYQKSVDLSAYAGQRVYIAFRHFNCSDMFFICLDDIELIDSAPKNEQDVEKFIVYRSNDGNQYEPIAEVPFDGGTDFQHLDDAGFGEWYYQVTAMHNNNGEICESEPVSISLNAECASPINLQSASFSNNTYLVWTYNVEGDKFSYDFDDGEFGGWTQIDADGDGHLWEMSLIENTGHNGSAHYVTSASFSNSTGALHPDNYLVSPRVKIGSNAIFSFWAAPQDATYPHEHYGVAISTASNSNPNDFTTIWESTLFKTRDQGTWYEHEIDLSDYVGQEMYIAIRHFDCSDNFMIDIDDIELSFGGRNSKAVDHFNIYRGASLNDMELVDEVPFTSFGAYSYLVEPGSNGYYYRVTAHHSMGSHECESAPAHAMNHPEDDYIQIGTTTIDEDEGFIRIYPNPTQGNLSIVLDMPSMVSVYNMFGQCIYQSMLEEGNNNIYLYNIGIYYININNSSSQITTKVVVTGL